ncbi:hypothetical protein L3Q82_014797 [Scortum barcoo]|uniref:Uncharacterized protein n=1 Tax=Scortum barcoo TaxID=214431 RepID=A0ACB8VSB2_9TELE|nr:hypothetical protein L3Q82_014797 [Scortum barcoo]
MDMLYKKKKYIAVRNPMTWWAARDYCRQKYMDLTSMRNQQEKEAIMSVIDGWMAGGLVCTEMFGGGLTRVTLRSERGQRVSPMVMC